MILYQFIFMQIKLILSLKILQRIDFEREAQSNIISADREHICELTIEG